MAAPDMRNGTVISVHDTGLYEVEFEDNEEIFTAVSQHFSYYNDSTGAMSGSIAEPGDAVVCVRIPPSDAWEIIAFRSQPRMDDPFGQDTGDDPDRFDYKGARPELVPGDSVIAGTRRNKVLVSRDGNVEVSSTQFCRTDWLINEQRVRTLGMTVETSGLFGSAEWFTDIDQDLDAMDSVPTGYREAISRSSGSPPIFYEFKGAVPKEGALDTSKLEGIPEQEDSRVCFVRRIVPEETAAKVHVASKDITDKMSSYVLKQDDRGNKLESLIGDRFYFARADVQTITRDYSVSAGGKLQLNAVEGAAIRSKSTLHLQGDRGITLSSKGKLTFDVAELEMRGKTSRSEKVEGSYNLEAESGVKISAGTSAVVTSGQGLILSAGKDVGITAKGTINLEANNAHPGNMLQDTPSYKANVYGGKHVTNVAEGSYEVTVGPEQAPIAKIKIHNNPLSPLDIGSIEITTFPTGAGFKIKPDGSWEVGGMQGMVKADTTGKITLGSSMVPVGGNIVTTLSHPVDYMTGAPILGHAMATVAAGPVAPGPGPSSLGIMPPIVPVPEVPAK